MEPSLEELSMSLRGTGELILLDYQITMRVIGGEYEQKSAFAGDIANQKFLLFIFSLGKQLWRWHSYK